ncbi:MAG: hypothetical protein LBQ57_08810 [Spirochaetales bacterium]|jgi:hypothetical protein|nr:hypothetical protein [Spirochaetales bacterium]
MKSDITSVLRAWPYNPQKAIRIITAPDDRKVIQLRLPQGIEQYNLDGRPDGSRPYGCGSVLEEFENRLKEYTDKHSSDAGFHFTYKEYAELRNEVVLYYFRYLLLFRAGAFEKALRDSDHAMRICSFVENYVAPNHRRTAFLEYKPYILWVYTVSRLIPTLQSQDVDGAEIILKEAIAEMSNLSAINTPSFQIEKKRSLRHLESSLQQIGYRTSVPLRYLQKELEHAAREENHEKAASVRNRLHEID